MKFRVSLAGSSNAGGEQGGFNGGSIPNMAMNFNAGNIVQSGGNNPLGNLSQGEGIILSSDEVLEVTYNTTALTAETMSETQSEITVRIVGRLLPGTTENQASSEEGSEGVVGGIMGALGMGTLFNQYKSVKDMFKHDNNDKGTQGLLSSGNAPTGFQREPQEIKGSSLLSSSGPSGAVSENGNNKKELVSKVLGVSSALPMTNSFANGIGSSLAGMFGGLSSFGASNLYDQNKQNIIDISKWAMVYGEGTSTKDVLIQADLGSGKTMELYFPKMYVYSFNQDFSIGNGEGYFVLDLKQTGFNEEGITLK